MPETLIRKLEYVAPLSDEDKRRLTEAVVRTQTLDADEDLIREGAPPADCHLILDGVFCRYKLLDHGKRQIIGFQIAGDLCDLSGFLMGRMDHSVGTLTRATVGVIPHQTLRTILASHPGLTLALWRETLIDAAIAREWIANIGRRTAYRRVAHLLCEIGVRLEVVGRLVDEMSFEWLVTQAEVADAMGLSTVHVNRTLQQLRGEGLIAMQGSEIRILDWQGLQAAGDFTPDYLFVGPGHGNERDRPSIEHGMARS